MPREGASIMAKKRGFFDGFFRFFGWDLGRAGKQVPSNSANRPRQFESLEQRCLLSIASGPVAHPIPPINISQGSTTVAVPLTNDFQEIGGAQSALRYQVVADSNRSLFLSPPVVARTSMLFLQPAPNALGKRHADRLRHGRERPDGRGHDRGQCFGQRV